MKLPIEQLTELLKDLKPHLDGRKKNLVINCPYCGERESSISVEEGHRFGCFRKKKCGEVGNIFTILRYIGKTIGYTAQGIPSLDRLETPLLDDEDEEEASQVNVQIELPTVKMPDGWKRLWGGDPYLEERGFTEYAKYEVGRTLVDRRVRKDYVIFILRFKGEVVGWLGRHIKPKKWIEEQNRLWKIQTGIGNKIKRYSNASGVDFGKILYGIEECNSRTNTIFLVEGLFDKIAVERKMDLDLYDEVKCCCTFKCAITDEQLFQIIQMPNIDTIVLLYDSDVVNEINAAAQKLESYGYNVLVGFSKTGKDPDEMNNEEFAETLENVRPPGNFALDFVDQGLM
jgi:hypothetical protein